MVYDAIIVGQGLAGVVMAETLEASGQTFRVIDDWDYSSCSKVSVGMYNPIVFKRLTKSWMVDESLPLALNFYRNLEERLGIQLIHPRAVQKPFADQREVDFWHKKAAEPLAVNYLRNDGQLPTYMAPPTFGAGKVVDAGNIDVLTLITRYRKYLQQQGWLLAERFNHARISFNAADASFNPSVNGTLVTTLLTYTTLSGESIQARRILFCEGYRALANPYFKDLPFKLTKGEVLHIFIPDLAQADADYNDIVMKQCSLLPLGGGHFRVGATYNWDDLTETITEAAREELTSKLACLLTVPFKVVDQQVGIRPTVNDRRPLIGFHPHYPQLGIFNGLGTKAVILAPYFAQHFVEHIKTGMPLMKEVDVRRGF